MFKFFARSLKQGSSPIRGTTSNPANTDKRKMKPFEIRWNEPLGIPECPYMYRWMLSTPWFSVRIHKWYRSDDKRYLHDHAANFSTFILKGSYTDVTDDHREFLPQYSFRYRKAEHKHYVHEPEPGTITILFFGKKVRNWGFYVDDKFIRPLKFFKKYGHPPCSEK